MSIDKNSKKSRKELPCFGILGDYEVDIDSIISFCVENNYFDVSQYNDINVSSNSKMKSFVITNAAAREDFFKNSNEKFLESEFYKQKYLTEIDKKIPEEALSSPRADEGFGHINKDTYPNIFRRMKRLNPNHPQYVPEADEYNYGKRNHLVKGEIEKVLDIFKGRLTRVRFAYLAPGFNISPHIDYDPSYITRLHIPLITNNKCKMCIKVKGKTLKTHFPADGKIYFLNTGHIHWAENNSDESRIHLIVDTKDQTDLESLHSLL